MSRGLDGFEIDDFRGSHSRFDRDMGGGSSSSWDSRNARHNIWREEDRADRLDRQSRERPAHERPPLAREERVQAILSQRVRTKYTDRNKEYSLRDSEIHTLGEVLLKGMSREMPPLRLDADTFLSRHSAQLFERALSIREWSSSGRVAYFVPACEAQERFLFPVVPYPCCDGALRF